MKGLDRQIEPPQCSRKVNGVARTARPYRLLAAASILALALGACTSGGTESTDAGSGYTPEDVEIVVHSGPGGGNDTLARAMAQILADEGLADSVYPVLNETGGSGAAAMAYMVEQTGEPNTWGVHTSVWVATPLRLGGNAPTIEDLTPIAQLVEERSVLAVAADSPYETLQDLIDAAGNERLVQAGGSVGALDHVNGLLLQEAAGVEWDFLSFEGGGERTAALLGGDADMQIEGARDFVEFEESGEVRVLAAFSDERNPLFPDVPTVEEATGLELDVIVERRGVTGPPDMPEEAVTYWTNLMEEMMATPSWKEFEEDAGFTPAFEGSDAWTENLLATQETLRGVFDDLGLLGSGA